ncbi:substrate-binding periplasmic protein [Roseibium alexandrii]|uniref:ABC-type amino acid transport/signal transduction system n=2 Tax=Roseibium alexandrii TaxID=388408 RepID=A0A5E8GTE5_ROSAD|nr:transporter substrate-binding domain-containing protein [Roseibium alexandrii]EEE43016.2 ABC-type amino acid transport/signal transduction system [Roseibium alexandrii DFL-11]
MGQSIKPRRRGELFAFLVVFSGVLFAGGPAYSSCDVLKVNGANEWRPFSWRTPELGEMKGIFPAIIHHVSKTVPVRSEYGPDLPWNRLFALLEHGSIDVLAGAYLSAERQTKFELSHPVQEDEVTVFIRAGMKAKPDGLDGLIGLRGRAPYGVHLGEDNNKFAADNLVIDSQSLDDIAGDLEMLTDGRFDYILMSRSYGKKAVSTFGFDGQIEDVPWTAARRSVHFIFSKESPCVTLLPEFNAVIDEQLQAGFLDEFQTGFDTAGGFKNTAPSADTVAE